MVPRQYDALASCHKRAIRHRDAMFCRIEAAVINFSMSPPKKPVTLDDLLPSDKPRRKPRGPSRKMLAYLESQKLRMAMVMMQAAQDAGK